MAMTPEEIHVEANALAIYIICTDPKNLDSLVKSGGTFRQLNTAFDGVDPKVFRRAYDLIVNPALGHIRSLEQLQTFRTAFKALSEGLGNAYPIQGEECPTGINVGKLLAR
jgi:hypothetical protein